MKWLVLGGWSGVVRYLKVDSDEWVAERASATRFDLADAKRAARQHCGLLATLAVKALDARRSAEDAS